MIQDLKCFDWPYSHLKTNDLVEIIHITHRIHMNKAAIVDKVHEVLGGTKAQSERAVDTMVYYIINTLKSGE